MLGVLFAVATVTVAAQPYRVGIDTGRDALLVDPAPHQPTKVDSPDRLENGRLWVSRGRVSSRVPAAEMVHGVPNAAWYGAAPSAEDEVIFIRVGTQAIAIDPFTRYTDCGMDFVVEAQNQWLREQGYVLSVRTHVNPRYHSMDESARYAEVTTTENELPQPRATIRLKSGQDEPKRLRASVDSLREGDRVVKPDVAPVTGPAISYDEWLASSGQGNPTDATIAEAEAETEESGA